MYIGSLLEVYESAGQAATESFDEALTLISLKVMIFLFIVGLILSVLAGALVKYAVEKEIFSRTSPRKCGGGRCGDFGWTLVRKDSESCHAVCVKCGWINHFDIKQWQKVK